jgi:putative sigma-54 modulation protein
MSIIISVRSGNISDTLKEYAEKKAQVIIEDYSKITSVRVILDTQKSRYKAEVIMRGKNINIEADQESYDMYDSIDTAMDKISKQLRRHLDKIQDHNKPVKLQKRKDEEELVEAKGFEEYVDM